MMHHPSQLRRMHYLLLAVLVFATGVESQCLPAGEWSDSGAWSQCVPGWYNSTSGVATRTRQCILLPVGCAQNGLVSCIGSYSQVQWCTTTSTPSPTTTTAKASTTTTATSTVEPATTEQINCCPALMQSATMSDYPDGMMTFTYSNNACRTNVSVFCSFMGNPPLVIETIECRLDPRSTPPTAALTVKPEAEQTDCCPALLQSITKTEFPNGAMTFTYDNNTCRSNVLAFCTQADPAFNLFAAIVINGQDYMDYGFSDVTFPGTCNGRRWFMGSSPLTIETIECRLTNPPT